MTATASRVSSFVPNPKNPSRRQKGRRSSDQRSLRSSEEEIVYKGRPDADELRRIRADFYTTSPEIRRTKSPKPMDERPHTRRSSSARKFSNQTPPEVKVREIRDIRSSEHRHRRRKTRVEDDDRQPENVYVYRPAPVVTHLPPLQRSNSTAAASTCPREARRSSDGSGRRDTERRDRHPKPEVITIKRIARHAPEPATPPDASHRRQSIARSASTRERGVEHSTRPPLLRSNTTTRKLRPEPPPRTPKQEQIEPAPSVARNAQRPSSFFGSILGIPRAPPAPEKQVECLTCLSTYPASRTARLACSHRMCHACLRRIFTLSLTDPQHMPPKCCTADHIPLKHVEKLFDTKFKMKWNVKYQEYTTKNRLYCPRRGCGEWIKPKDIHIDSSGSGDAKPRKYGKCGRCKTKVCATCNGRWHASRTCPKDDATKQFIEVAKREGWQRCYNCSATVELKEGCNHMTCRCKAEFCMICGVKWKGCDCPWFNYQTVEQDRLNHMNIPAPRRVVVVSGQDLGPDHPRAARGYQAELDARREQERRDEELARRLQGMGMHGGPPGVEIYQVTNGQENGFGVGNGASHHINTHFVSYHVQPPPPRPLIPVPEQPLLRQHSRASRAYNNRNSTRPAERVVPRRSATDYAHEAAVHAPLRSATVGVGGMGGVSRMGEGEVKGSTLAGLTRGGTAEGRVEEWRRWVDSVG